MSMGATTQNYIDLQDAGCQVGLVHFMLLGVCVGKASKSATAQSAPTHFTVLGAGVGRASKSASAQTGPTCEPFFATAMPSGGHCTTSVGLLCCWPF